ncbi:MAG: bifunctional proline dehydrogenase/L-glutamate gamma-semialdehyde dehydrogenase PutA [Rhodospirillales bacterium]|nr:bifunctional proline dehydrogenase/L-glutamate gamma-semialdehyde dehydrogenase PutA [Rhodospirillales bacterium]
MMFEVAESPFLPPPAEEGACVRALLGGLAFPADARRRAEARAGRLVEAVRGRRAGGLDAFLHAYGLSTEEGVLLMCIAEALLRIPDEATRERLIRDKLSAADWERHLGRSGSVLVNASTWALMLTGRLVRLHGEIGHGLAASFRRLMARVGEPMVTEAVTQAMRILGRQFVMARTIEQAIARARPLQGQGWRFSYDMLGESARTMDDAERYAASYAGAIAAVGAAAVGGGDVHTAAGISVKLSALHPRFEEAQLGRVRSELVPRVRELACAAAAAGIGLTIDAEESERLAPTLDVIAAVAGDPALAGWEGLGAVVQTYLRAAPCVINHLAEVARRCGRRLMLRLVKGAYWDAEIKRAQELGLAAYPVFTRKATTDVSYLACAGRVLAASDAFYPQFATHNAHTIAAVLELAADTGRDPLTDLEFQRLHGMGEALYEQLMAAEQRGIGCRVYAPVGAHEDLLAYLVRRLLENGTNSSFVNRLQDDRLPVAMIVADPVARIQALSDIANSRIPLPRLIYASRLNACGIDLTDRTELAGLAVAMTRAEAAGRPRAGPIVGGEERSGVSPRDIVSPADTGSIVGRAAEAGAVDIDEAVGRAVVAAPEWAALPVDARSACLERAAVLLEDAMPALMTLLVREAGRTIGDAVAEVREAADFCRYYAQGARLDLGTPVSLPAPSGARRIRSCGGGVFACISPWNFPLAIFVGQVAAALAAGNGVLAKPAEQTPLIAAAAVRLLHRAGIPADVLHLLPGDGARVGGALTADARIDGVLFTGSIETARALNRGLAGRSGGIPSSPPVLIAETGGQNAMIVDSSALPEQVTRDAVASAFRSAGQRCSAARVLFVQEEAAAKILAMLAGAMAELAVGDPALPATDVGPVIDSAAQTALEAHIARMSVEGKLLARAPRATGPERGLFVAPALIEIDALSQLPGEVFGPVLHVIRWAAGRLPAVLEEIEATGFGLTLGVQSRIDETARFVFDRTTAGNVYVNRNQIGAVVGAQPFGGGGLSGTGPKAGGPGYLHRLVAHRPPEGLPAQARTEENGEASLQVVDLDRSGTEAFLAAAVAAATDWRRIPAARRAEVLEAAAAGIAANTAAEPVATALRSAAAHARARWAQPLPLPGVTGERNQLWVRPLGVLACVCAGDHGRFAATMVAAALAAGNAVILARPAGPPDIALMEALAAAGLSSGLLTAAPAGSSASVADLLWDERLAAVAMAAPAADVAAAGRLLAERDGPIVRLIVCPGEPFPTGGIGAPLSGTAAWFERFVHERTLTVDTTAAGGNAALLALDE